MSSGGLRFNFTFVENHNSDLTILTTQINSSVTSTAPKVNGIPNEITKFKNLKMIILLLFVVFFIMLGDQIATYAKKIYLLRLDYNLRTSRC